MCLGYCPAYKLHILGSGEVIYKGKEFVKKLGIVKFEIPQKSIYKLLLHAIDIEFFNMKNDYSVKHEYTFKNGIVLHQACMVTCSSSTITEIKIGKKSKKVENYISAPKRLTKFQNAIDKAVNMKELI